MSKKTLIFLIISGLAVFGFWHFVSAFTISDITNNGAPQRDAYAGATNVLIMDISLPDPGTDTALAGSGTPSAGSAIVTTNPWTATGGVRFYDDGDGVWESVDSSDVIVTDDDKDEKYTVEADQVVDVDGSTSITDWGAAVNDGETAGATLLAVPSPAPGTTPALYYYDADSSNSFTAGDDVIYEPTAGAQSLVADLSGSDDDDGDLANDDDVVISDGGDGTQQVTDGATIVQFAPTDYVKFYDADADSAYDLGEDIFIDYHDGGTYSAAGDTVLASGAPADGTALTSTNPWASATIPVFFYDDGDSAWESASDGIFTDDDQSGYYNGDKISSVVVQNIENALDDDISAIKIWQENTTPGFQSSEDTLIGSDTSGAKWGQTISAGSAVVYTASSKDRIYVTADIASNAINGRIIQARIPVDGLQFVSTSDGPTDSPIVNPYTQTIVSGTTGSVVDNIAPSSSITDPEDGQRIDPGVDYTIQGTCSDEGGSSVMQVEISLDGGTTWYVATPGQSTDSGFSWSYLWQTPDEGSYIIKTRATDWVGNTESPAEGITVEVRELTCSDYTTEDECVSSGCYWYEDACHSEEQAVEEEEEEEGVEEEKPIEEMTAEELQAKILEIQQQIVELLQQLIEMIKQQILELGGSV